MGLWRHQMTSSIYQYPLITYDVIDEVGKLSKNIFWKVFIIPEIKKKIMRIGLLEKKLWPRVLCMTSSLFPSITQISKIAVNHNFWPILIILDGNESWWPKFYEKYFCILMGGLWRHKTTSLFHENSVIAYDAYDVI